MKTINLVNPHLSDVKIEIIKFPDGQQQVLISTEPFLDFKALHFEIKSRLNNFLDLEIIVCAVQSLKNLGAKKINLTVPYFLGSRSDRKFEVGSNHYLKQVVCPIVNSLKLNCVKVMDPHSYVLEACLDNFRVANIRDFYDWVHSNLSSENFIVFSPDAGAIKRTEGFAKQIRYSGEISFCQKVRGVDGKITKIVVPHFDITQDVLIVDDICDGGKTFTEIGKVIRERYENYDREKSDKDHGKLYLVVTHGIFSKGFKELKEYFDAIYTTNSYRDFEDPTSEFVMREKGIQIVKQFNLF